MATVLFDLGSTFSYVFVSFVVGLYMVCDIIDASIYVSTAIGDFVIIVKVYFSYFLVYGLSNFVDFVILDIVDFNVIQGMNFLYL